MKPRRKVKSPLDRPPIADVDRAALVFKTLSEYFGDDAKAIEMMRAMASVTLVMPIPDVLERFIAERRIVMRLTVNPTRDAAARLAQVTGVEHSQITKIYERGTGKKLLHKMKCRIVPTRLAA